MLTVCANKIAVMSLVPATDGVVGAEKEETGSTATGGHSSLRPSTKNLIFFGEPIGARIGVGLLPSGDVLR